MVDQKLKVEILSTDKLIPYVGNAKEHPPEQIGQIAASIKAFGFNDPIAIDGDNVIIEGHGRLLAAQKLEMEKVPVIRLDHLTEAEKKAYIIAHNKLTLSSGFDMAVLKLEMEALKLEDFDLSLTGFEMSEIQKLFLTDEPQNPPEGDPDEAPEPPEQPFTQPGDLYEIGPHRLLCGDSTVATDVEKLLDGNKPFIMVTDPPYGVNYDPTWRDEAGGQFGSGKTVMRGKVRNDDKAEWTEAYSLFPGDVCYVWHAGVFAGPVANNLTAAGFEVRAQIIWVKPHFIMGRGSYHWQHEPCWYAVKKGKKSEWCGDRTQSTTWEIKGMDPAGGNKEEKVGHGTQKPVECMAKPIRNHGGVNSSVYDPFLGSGSTMVAAQLVGRSCFGMEIDPNYCDVIVARMKKLFPDLPVKRNGEPI